jgi:hypothetical protein
LKEKNKGLNDVKSENRKSNENISNRKRHVLKPSVSKKATLTMSQILKYAEYGILKKQEIELSLGKVHKPLEECVMYSDDVSDIKHGEKYFLWGGVHSINNNFININSNIPIAIIIDDGIINKFNIKHKNKILKNLDNRLVLAYGTFILKKQKHYLLLKDLKHLYHIYSLNPFQ